MNAESARRAEYRDDVIATVRDVGVQGALAFDLSSRQATEDVRNLGGGEGTSAVRPPHLEVMGTVIQTAVQTTGPASGRWIGSGD
jgi:hypothetical protein